MPTPFAVCVDANCYTILERSHDKHPIVSPIAVQLGDVWFPDKAWDDFSLVILETWLQQLIELNLGTARNARLRFMDGPFEVKVTPMSSHSWSVHCIRNDTRYLAATGECDPNEIVLQVVIAIRKILQGTRNANLWNTACSNLQDMLDRTFPAQAER